jgi:hypothetical protein
VFATSLVSSVLGGRALEDGLNSWDWTALALLLLVGLLAAVIVWPYRAAGFRAGADELLGMFGDSRADIDDLYRELATRLQAD